MVNTRLGWVFKARLYRKWKGRLKIKALCGVLEGTQMFKEPYFQHTKADI